MLKKIYILLLFIIIFTISQVNASNDVDYTLTITKDYNFNEVINYSLTNYKTINNGNNYFYMIVSDDVYTDITYKTKYKKETSKNNGVYNVKLSHSFSEYSLSNSRFLNDCFESSEYDYDMDTISFKGSGGFNCFNGDSLKIKIVTDFEVASTNAVNKGNTYTWIPTDGNFTMEIKLKKTYEIDKSKENAATDEALDYMDVPNNPNSIDDQDNEDKQIDTLDDADEETTSPFSGIIIAVIFIILSITAIIIIIILKQKKSNLNKI